MRIEDIDRAIYQWAQKMSGLKEKRVIWLRHSRPKIRKPFIGLSYLTGPSKTAFDEIRWPATEPKARQYGQRRITLSVNVYGNTALQIAADLQTSLDNPNVSEEFGRNCLAVTSVSEIRDLSELLDTKFESRAQFDVGFLYAVNDEIDLENIERVIIDADVGGNVRTPLVDVDSNP